jgi:hypothetical protein
MTKGNVITYPDDKLDVIILLVGKSLLSLRIIICLDDNSDQDIVPSIQCYQLDGRELLFITWLDDNVIIWML